MANINDLKRNNIQQQQPVVNNNGISIDMTSSVKTKESIENNKKIDRGPGQKTIINQPTNVLKSCQSQ